MLIPINNTNSFFSKVKSGFMGKSIFIKEIVTTEKEPRLCPTCQKEDKLETDVIREENSGGKTILCSRCEALVVITKNNLKRVNLSAMKNDTIMLKEPHLIRKLGY
jgi:hypothetical protein